MIAYFNVSCPAMLMLAITQAGCAGTPPVRYASIDSPSQLKPNTDEQSDRIPWRFSTPVDWKKYNRIIIEPVVIYQGAGNQFG